MSDTHPTPGPPGALTAKFSDRFSISVTSFETRIVFGDGRVLGGTEGANWHTAIVLPTSDAQALMCGLRDTFAQEEAGKAAKPARDGSVT
jgi:hypothetical protein